MNKAEISLVREHWEAFKKSSFSGATGCLEVAVSTLGNVMLRDSKLLNSPLLSFDRQEWTAFLLGVGASEFELPPDHTA